MEKAIFRTLCVVLLLLTSPGFSQSGDTITGTLLYHNISPMSNVNVYLHDSSGDVVATTITNSNGNYSFPNVTAGDYSITFSTSSPAGGVNLTDAYIIMLHLIGIYPSWTPLQELASDVNGSGNVNWADYIFILVSYLNQGNQFPIGPWVFEPVSFTAGARSGPISSGGSSSGDANGTFVPTKTSEYLVQEDYFENEINSMPRELSIPVSSPDQFLIGGMHMVIDVPQGLSVNSVESPLEDLNYSVVGQELRVTWMDPSMAGYMLNSRIPLFTVNASVDQLSREMRSFALAISPESHFIGNNGDMLSGIHITLPSINLVVDDAIALNAFPNPFYDRAMIELKVPDEGKITVLLYDNTGRLISEIDNGVIPGGSHTSIIDGTSLAPGTYYYKVSYEGADVFVKTGTMIKSK